MDVVECWKLATGGASRMNTNDMDRYYRRTGHRWSGDYRSDYPVPRWARLSGRLFLFLLACGVATQIAIFLMHRP